MEGWFNLGAWKYGAETEHINIHDGRKRNSVWSQRNSLGDLQRHHDDHILTAGL